jgi:hypothetical protein
MTCRPRRSTSASNPLSCWFPQAQEMLPSRDRSASENICLPARGRARQLVVGDDQPAIVRQSADRHGVTADDALHAWAIAVDAYDVGEGMIMYVGPDRAGRLLEIGVVQCTTRSRSFMPCPHGPDP